MGSFTLGDIFFILMAGAITFGILALVGRSRNKKRSPETVITDDAGVRAILETRWTVAMVGASSDPDRPSHHVMEYLMEAGYTVYPINPKEQTILGRPAFASLADLPVAPDIVDVFRNPEHVPAIAKEAIAAGASILWLQEGVVNEEGARIAFEGGLSVVMDRCMLKEHKRLFDSPRDGQGVRPDSRHSEK
jgi:hypothetical protein